MKERGNILRILRETLKAIKEEEYSKIKNLSNQTINTASLTQDSDNIAVAVIVYSLSKILERKSYREYSGWETFYKTIISSLEKSIKDIEQNDLEKFRKDFIKIRNSVKKLSGKLKGYIEEVLRKAQINKASRLYEHGISMGGTAELLGITLYELADYVGKTGISDVSESKTLSVKQRIKLAERFFE